MAAIFQIFDGLQVAGAGALRGLKDTAIPMVITLVAYWGLGLPLGAWLGLVLRRRSAGAVDRPDRRPGRRRGAA